MSCYLSSEESDEFDFGGDDDHTMSDSDNHSVDDGDFEYDEEETRTSSNAAATGKNSHTAAAKKRRSSGKKKKTVEETYQKKTQLEHILLRPDSYVGSTESVTQPMFFLNTDNEHRIVQREITYTPGFYKIFDEIIVNAADNKQRDPKGMDRMEVEIISKRGIISVMNNGKGIPVVMHKEHNCYVPTLIFGQLLTVSNYYFVQFCRHWLLVVYGIAIFFHKIGGEGVMSFFFL